MHEAQRHDHDTSPAPSGGERSLHRRCARVLGLCVFVGLMFFAASLVAQHVLMAPRVEASFESVRVTGAADSVNIDYQINRSDWQWAKDFGMDVFVALYTPATTDGGDDSWQLQRVEQIVQPEGEASFDGGFGTGRIGVCMIAASVEGGKLAPGAGYVCEEPLVVSTGGASIDFEQTRAAVGLAFEPNIDEQPWYTPQRGFARASSDDENAAGQAGAEQTQADQTNTNQTNTDQRGVEQVDGEFFSYRAPSPGENGRGEAEDGAGIRIRRSQQQNGPFAGQDDYRRSKRHQSRGQTGCCCGHRSYGLGFYSSGFSSGHFLDRGRFGADRFRRRRMHRQRRFGPTRGPDGRFNQGMFQTHPGDVFYNFPVTPGYFGRDGSGRDPNSGSRAPRKFQRGPSGFDHGSGTGGAGQSFE